MREKLGDEASEQFFIEADEYLRSRYEGNVPEADGAIQGCVRQTHQDRAQDWSETLKIDCDDDKFKIQNYNFKETVAYGQIVHNVRKHETREKAAAKAPLAKHTISKAPAKRSRYIQKNLSL